MALMQTTNQVGVFGNVMADLLLKEGSGLPSVASCELFASEILSILRVKTNSILRVPPVQDCLLEIVPIISRYKILTDCIGHAVYWSYQKLEIRRQGKDLSCPCSCPAVSIFCH
ncbi:hypothetical protein TNCT_494721 [Trichonephila clavata]|uniref:Uncharacterized protein n=1 Tax=Trichonephila clavata TaxID=2740835 RepID=A0A8X6H556_TRICU|nr:hypothetical protein TNCT_494721 [Trichonephila clavata]